MQGFRGAPGGAFFGLQRVGPETALRWRDVSPVMLLMLACRFPARLQKQILVAPALRATPSKLELSSPPRGSQVSELVGGMNWYGGST